ncbi:hypothetical protein K0M31_007430 [Melipona bicolor]|uniref:Uncharacterized protein n=1 Tax=Melipona bicolor TaxID=60889 RepID=A0AA40GBN5_9HYME|nr:hypothetical protein K0M31_007430 [Melipona bicolor]
MNQKLRKKCRERTERIENELEKKKSGTSRMGRHARRRWKISRSLRTTRNIRNNIVGDRTMKNRGCSYLTKSCLCLSRQSSKLTSSGASERAFIIANDACDTAERIASLDYTGQTHKLHPVAFVLLSSIILALCTPPEESSDWLFAQWGTFCQSRSRYRPGPANSGKRGGDATKKEKKYVNKAGFGRGSLEELV